jgi:hypothetical protein
MSSVQEIEAVLPKLSRAEIEEVRGLIDGILNQSIRENGSARLIRENGRTLGVTARTVTLADTQKALEHFP